MPVVPTFADYAPAPNLAEAYLGRERLRQEAAADAARISLGYATLQQRQVENEMELAAKKEIDSRNALMKAQEAEIDNAYRNTQVGLAQRRLEQEDLEVQRRLREAALGFEAEQNYARVRSDLMAKGMAEPEASEQAMRQVGFGQPGFAGALTPAQPQSQLPVVNFQFRQLQAAKDDIIRRFPGKTILAIPPELKAKLDEISKQQQALSPGIGIPASPIGTNTQVKRLRYNRSTGEFD